MINESTEDEDIIITDDGEINGYDGIPNSNTYRISLSDPDELFASAIFITDGDGETISINKSSWPQIRDLIDKFVEK